MKPSALDIARRHVVERPTLRAPAGTFPLVRAFVAELRAAGLEPTLTWAREGGLEVGVRDTRRWVRIALPLRPAKPSRGQPSR